MIDLVMAAEFSAVRFLLLEVCAMLENNVQLLMKYMLNLHGLHSDIPRETATGFNSS